MPYPEADADYEHKPKFIDRMKAEENAGPRHWPNPSTAEMVNAKDEMRDKLAAGRAGELGDEMLQAEKE